MLGEPVDALKEQAVAAGLDPDYLDKEFPDYRTIPEYNRYFDDRRRGVAVEVLKQKMVEEGLDENVLDVYDMGETQVIRVDYVRYIEWFRRKESGEDIEALSKEMEKEGLDASVLEHDVNSIEFINIPYQVIISGDEQGLVMVPATAPAEEKAVSAAAQPVAAVVPATCQHHYEKMVDYKYYKFFKLAKNGLPKEGLKMKMGLEGLDGSVLDLDMSVVGFTDIPEDVEITYPDGHVEPCCKPGDVVAQSAQPAQPAAPATCQHHYEKMVEYKYYKFFKLAKNGLPKEGLKMKMGLEGLDGSVLDYDLSVVGFTDIPEDVEITYPDGHVEPCCKPGAAPAPAAQPAAPTTCQHHYEKMVDYKYYKFFKLAKNGLPKEGLKMKMGAEGLDGSILDLDMNTVGFTDIPEDVEITYPDGHVEPCCKPGAAAEAPAPATCQHHYEKMVDYKYYKYFKLAKNGLPKEGLKMKMGAEGLDSSVLDLDLNTVGFTNIPEDVEITYPDGHVEPCCKPGAAPAASSGTCQHHYEKMVDYDYYKHFKSLRDGIPRKQVEMRMKMDDLDVSVLNLDMSKVGFTNIPDGKEVVYPDGHVEPCVRVASVPKPVLRPTANAKARMSVALSSSRTAEKPKDEILPPRKKFTHAAKLRSVYWDNITSKSVLEKSMWVHLDDHAVKLDTAMLDTAFAAKDIAVTLPTETVKKEESKVVNLLDAKREKNVGITIGRLKVPVSTIHRALLFGDFTVLTKDIVPLLVNAAPTPDEQMVCNAYQGDVSKLSGASRFVYELSDIPSVQTRLECCRTVVTIDDEEARLKEIRQIYETNLRFVKNCQGLKKLCQILLAIGNYLNGDSARGGAWGFRIEYLRKINTTKCADGSRTLAT